MHGTRLYSVQLRCRDSCSMNFTFKRHMRCSKLEELLKTPSTIATHHTSGPCGGQCAPGLAGSHSADMSVRDAHHTQYCRAQMPFISWRENKGSGPHAQQAIAAGQQEITLRKESKTHV